MDNYKPFKVSKDLFKISIWEIPFWLYFAFRIHMYPGRKPYFSFKSIMIDSNDVALIITALIYLIFTFFSRFSFTAKFKFQDWAKKLPLFFLILCLYAATSVNWANLDNHHYTGILFSVLPILASFFLAYFFISSLSKQEIMNFMNRFLFVFSVYCLLFTILAVFGLRHHLFRHVKFYNPVSERVSAPFLFSVTAAYVVVPLIAFALQQLFTGRMNKFIYLFCFASLTLTLFGVLSRGAVIVIILFIMLLFFWKKSIDKKLIPYLIIILVVSFSVATIVINFPFSQRLAGYETPARDQLYQRSLEIVDESSLIENIRGQGYGGVWPWYNYYRTGGDNIRPKPGELRTIMCSSHSDLLIMVVELGLLGLIFYLWLYFVIFKTLFLNRKNNHFYIFNCAIAASLLTGIYSNPTFVFYSAAGVMWWIFLLALLKLTYSENNKLNSSNITYNFIQHLKSKN